MQNMLCNFNAKNEPMQWSTASFFSKFIEKKKTLCSVHVHNHMIPCCWFLDNIFFEHSSRALWMSFAQDICDLIILRYWE